MCVAHVGVHLANSTSLKFMKHIENIFIVDPYEINGMYLTYVIQLSEQTNRKTSPKQIIKYYFLLTFILQYNNQIPHIVY